MNQIIPLIGMISANGSRIGNLFTCSSLEMMIKLEMQRETTLSQYEEPNLYGDLPKKTKVQFRDLDEFNIINRFDLSLKSIFASDPAASKNTTHFKVVKSEFEIFIHFFAQVYLHPSRTF